MRNLFKKSVLKPAVAFAGAATLSMSASAFDNVVIFGDSLSDTGNIATLFPGAPERFSNGPVAVDFLAGAYGFAAVPSLQGGNNYAFGGAVAIDADGDENTPDTNLPTQVNSYLLNNGFAANPGALYAVIIGGNDLFAAQAIRAASVAEESGKERQNIRKAAEARVTQAIESVEAQITKLLASGAQNLIVATAPDIAYVPNTDGTVAQLTAAADDHQEAKRAEKFYKYSSKLTSQYNEELAAAVARLEETFGVDIVEWDLEGFLNNQIEDAEVLGYTNTEDACAADGQLPLCEGYVFVDGVHPTTVVHERGAAQILELLNQ